MPCSKFLCFCFGKKESQAKGKAKQSEVRPNQSNFEVGRPGIFLQPMSPVISPARPNRVIPDYQKTRPGTNPRGRVAMPGSMHPPWELSQPLNQNGQRGHPAPIATSNAGQDSWVGSSRDGARRAAMEEWEQTLAAFPIGEWDLLDQCQDTANDFSLTPNPASNTPLPNHHTINLPFRNTEAATLPASDPSKFPTQTPALNPATFNPPALASDFTVFPSLAIELRLEIWERTFARNRIIMIRQRRQIEPRSVVLLDRLDVGESAPAPVEALSAHRESRIFAENQYPQAFGTNLGYLGPAANQVTHNAYLPRMRYSARRDIVYIDDQANVGLANIVHLMHDHDRAAIQRLALPITTSREADIQRGLIDVLRGFHGLQELILVVDEDVSGARFRNSRQGFPLITAAWDTALREYYDVLQQEHPKARRPTWSFRVPGWQDWYEGRTRAELGVVGGRRRASIGGRNGLDFGEAAPAIQEPRRSF